MLSSVPYIFSKNLFFWYLGLNLTKYENLGTKSIFDKVGDSKQLYQNCINFLYLPGELIHISVSGE